jgi:hypothetical protein
MENYKTLTHEKHLDHLVRVVPLLSFAYGVQSYMMLNFARGGSTGFLIFTLGVSLALSVIALVTYDYKCNVFWSSEKVLFKYPWSFHPKSILMSEISSVEIVGEPEEFQTLILKLKNKRKHTFYFVDNAFELKDSFETPQTEKLAA